MESHATTLLTSITITRVTGLSLFGYFSSKHGKNLSGTMKQCIISGAPKISSNQTSRGSLRSLSAKLSG